MGSKSSEYALEFCNISKRYPGVLALDAVNISILNGEVHALVGENGAGKSTLIKTCSGAIKPTAGTVIIKEKSFKELTPLLARQNNISVIYQEFNLVNDMTVYDNIYLGERISKGIFIDKRKMIENTRKLFERLGIRIDPCTLVKDLSVGYQQMVEIAKAIAKDANMLIMDEPSAPLTTTEVENLFKLIRQLKSKGVSMIYISHRLDEIFSICDRVSVLRDGKHLKTMNVRDTTHEELVTLMVGRTLDETFPQRYDMEQKKVVLEMKNVFGNGLKDISLKVYKGEILGIGGLVGSGRTEIAQLLFGIARVRSGNIFLHGKEYQPKTPRFALQNGIALAPEDRKKQGVFLHLNVKENIVISILKKISRFGFVNKQKELSISEKLAGDMSIKCTSTAQIVGTLSGGNQQKAVIAKWLAVNPEIVIFDEPTRGIDVGAKQEIYQLLNALVAAGKTVIMISSVMEELLGMSDRIIVMSEKKVSGEITRAESSQEKILLLASGGANQNMR